MNTRLILLSVLTVVVAGILALAVHAQDQSVSTVYVSGLEMGKGRTAQLRVTNASQPGNVMTLQVTAVYPDGQLAALQGGITMFSDQTVNLDIGTIVNARRALNEVGPYEGLIQIVATGFDGPVEPFAPETVLVEGIQTTRGRTYNAHVEWR